MNKRQSEKLKYFDKQKLPVFSVVMACYCYYISPKCDVGFL